MSQVILNFQLACDNASGIPEKRDFIRWLKGALLLFRDYYEVTIRLVNEDEIHKLNMTYRGKNRPTNILSFKFESTSKVNLHFLGDLVICSQIVKREAQKQKKAIKAHWAHIVIHGSLHLLGYNHLLENEALVMESLETEIMQKFGYPDPYLGR
ncbi:Endoribonuclease YbeY [secondary endosymbiont of Trabutina mannipara]|uniref:Endoribonuclease YbeY n=1 Tax=secondary endosymbiont of Trabutina mannipara TaxID=1835721 RepID=A0A1C3L409_9ENTR|nr:rRNA maturation RNase YbeY [secondary endosymbiont of Trabutina mannipara]SBT82023.1 Endoribonuclease YbeY [secondary endosymbiont of Trabutina mannipara]